MPADVIDAIDIPYRSILDATDKHCSKNTYVSAAKLAKKTVIEARARSFHNPRHALQILRRASHLWRQIPSYKAFLNVAGKSAGAALKLEFRSRPL